MRCFIVTWDLCQKQRKVNTERIGTIEPLTVLAKFKFAKTVICRLLGYDELGVDVVNRDCSETFKD